MTQERVIGTDVAKVDANAKADAPNASDSSKINTPKINVKRGIGKPCIIVITLSKCVYLRQQALRDAQSAGEFADTGKFDATIDAKKEAKKRQQNPMRKKKPTQS